jgi:flavin reductase (DIM6/NTAB) family NADH-FMN oxidoreductase RutF/predicted ester cyclase
VSSDDASTTAIETFRRSVTEAWEAAWDHGDVDALDRILHADYLLENAVTGSRIDADGLKQEVREVRSAFPDLRTTIDSLVIDGNEFALFWTSRGTFTGPLGEALPTGRPLTTSGAIRGSIEDWLIVRERVTWDLHELLRVVGTPRLGSAFEEFAADDERPDLTGAAEIRRFNKQFVTGVTVVTAIDASGAPRGLAVNSYASVSFDPPLVLVCVQKSSSTYPALFEATRLGINVLGSDQREVVDVFASKSTDKFAVTPWHPAPHGSPLITGSAASLEAEIRERFHAKTHTVFIARVTHAEATDVAPMIYKAGRMYSGEHLEEI